MARYGMVIDTVRCVGCMDCMVACKTENQVPEGFNRDWIAYETRGAFPTVSMEIRSERCNHCDDAPCVSCCPTGASHVDPFGRIVLVDHDFGDGHTYTTLYAHANGLRAIQGQEVHQGDVLGLVGTTGLTEEAPPRLHFEVRYNGTPQDPLAWVAR